MRILAIAAAATLFAGAALAQSALPNPSQPGSGYKVPETAGVNNPTQSPAQLADPNKPGSGYQAPTGPSANAPATPAVTESGSLPKGGKNKN